VFRGHWRGTDVAVKQLLIQTTITPELLAEFRKEVAMLSALRHPNTLVRLESHCRFGILVAS